MSWKAKPTTTPTTPKDATTAFIFTPSIDSIIIIATTIKKYFIIFRIKTFIVFWRL